MIYFLGIDVSKAYLDMCLLADGSVIHEERISNEKPAIQGFIRHLSKVKGIDLEHLRICMEYTGIYNYKALTVLHRHKIKVCMEPAIQIKQSMGMTRGKDDRVDARRIAIYAYKNREGLRFWQPKRLVLQQLQAFLSLRDRLIKAKIQLQVPLQECVGYVEGSIAKSLKANSRRILSALSKELKELDGQIAELVQKDENLARQRNYITSVPGLGDITAYHLLVHTNEFKRFEGAKQFACFVGVVPFTHQSGSSIRGRTRVSKLANMTLKKLFHLAAMSTIQHSEEMKTYYQRKLTEGKNKMSVINAVRNKLITRVFACVRQERLYEQNYTHALA